MSDKKTNLIWIDLEMTGLDTDHDYIIEIATVVTDTDLNVVAEGPVLAIHQCDEILDGMDEWNTRQHNKSGLVRRVQETQVTVEEAEASTLRFLRRHTEKNCSPMAGNSICQDRRFMHRLMPELEQWFHYRNLDVSSVKELAKRWAPELLGGFKKNVNHLAQDDVYDSINELKYYRERFLKI